MLNPDEIGFGSKKSVAIELLRKTIDILNEFNINHSLISGTLLGYIRHNDFIPWDDDIDLLVDESIINKLKEIVDKHPEINLFKSTKYDSIKICFSDGIEIPENDAVINWKRLAVKGDKYCWPFIDMFIYEIGPGIHSCGVFENVIINQSERKFFRPFKGHPGCYENFRFFNSKQISFFHNEWELDKILPFKEVKFLNVNVKIPNNPDYFLTINYGSDYMVEKKFNINHKNEMLNK